jgi:hypothetical protein
MSRQQQGILKTLQRLLAAPLHTLDWHFQIGTQVAAWRDAFDIQPRDWLQQLATALETSKSRLYKDLVFAREYTGREVEQLEALGCSWKVVETAQRLPDKKARKRLLKEALESGWNVAELENAIQKTKNQTPHAGGRPMRVPGSVEQGLQQLQLLSGKWLKFFEVIWQQGDESVLKRLKDVPSSPELLRLVHDTRDLVQQVGTAAAEIDKALAAQERKAGQRRKG